MTRIRIFLARILYKFVRVFYRSDRQIITRKGITYQVDLSEGIELSLFLFGGFQSYIIENSFISLARDAVVLDIGANVGSMALQFAQKVPNGCVYAYEATGYAFRKFLKNLELNPVLSKRIVPINKIVSDGSGDGRDMLTFASWKVDGRAARMHSLHGGTLMEAVSETVSIDEFCLSKRIDRVDLLKIDTDGHEFTILKGARETIKRYKPGIIFEIGGYVMNEHGITFRDYYDYFSKMGYSMFNAKNDQPVNMNNFKNQIPMRSTTDIIAVPQER